MKKQIAIGIVFLAAAFAAESKKTFTGIITDNMCDKADHKEMNMGPAPKCVMECIKSMGGKYVLYDGKKAYALSDQKLPEKFAAQKVTVSGVLDTKTGTIQVDKIIPAK